MPGNPRRSRTSSRLQCFDYRVTPLSQSFCARRHDYRIGKLGGQGIDHVDGCSTCSEVAIDGQKAIGGLLGAGHGFGTPAGVGKDSEDTEENSNTGQAHVALHQQR